MQTKYVLLSYIAGCCLLLVVGPDKVSIKQQIELGPYLSRLTWTNTDYDVIKKAKISDCCVLYRNVYFDNIICVHEKK